MGIKINKAQVGNFFGTLGKGLLKEVVSYTPLIGDNLANSVEKFIGKKIGVNAGNDNILEVVGKLAPWAILVILFATGVINLDVFNILLESSK